MTTEPEAEGGCFGALVIVTSIWLAVMGFGSWFIVQERAASVCRATSQGPVARHTVVRWHWWPPAWTAGAYVNCVDGRRHYVNAAKKKKRKP